MIPPYATVSIRVSVGIDHCKVWTPKASLNLTLHESTVFCLYKV